jgi:hypothetical protein
MATASVPGQTGGQPGGQPGQPGGQSGQPGDQSGQPGDQSGQPGGQSGQPGQPTPSAPPPRFSPENNLYKVKYILNEYNPDYYAGIGYNTRDRGNQEPGHQYCKDDNTVGHLNQILDAQNGAINGVNYALGQVADLNEITKLYNSMTSNYDSRLSSLQARYAALGTPDDIRAKVNAVFDPVTQGLNEETTSYGKDNRIKTDQLDNYKQHIFPSLLAQGILAGATTVDADGRLSELTTKHLQNVQGLYQSIEDENSLVRGQLDKNANADTQYTRKSNFVETKYESLMSVRGVLFIAYYALVAIITVLLILQSWSGSRMQWIVNAVIIAVLGIFPFLAYPAELGFYKMCSFIYAIIRGAPYVSPKTLFPEERPMDTRAQKPPQILNTFYVLYSYLLNVPIWAFVLLVFGGIFAYTLYSRQ